MSGEPRGVTAWDMTGWARGLQDSMNQMHIVIHFLMLRVVELQDAISAGSLLHQGLGCALPVAGMVWRTFYIMVDELAAKVAIEHQRLVFPGIPAVLHTTPKNAEDAYLETCETQAGGVMLQVQFAPWLLEHWTQNGDVGVDSDAMLALRMTRVPEEALAILFGESTPCLLIIDYACDLGGPSD